MLRRCVCVCVHHIFSIQSVNHPVFHTPGVSVHTYAAISDTPVAITTWASRERVGVSRVHCTHLMVLRTLSAFRAFRVLKMRSTWKSLVSNIPNRSTMREVRKSVILNPTMAKSGLQGRGREGGKEKHTHTTTTCQTEPQNGKVWPPKRGGGGEERHTHTNITYTSHILPQLTHTYHTYSHTHITHTHIYMYYTHTHSHTRVCMYQSCSRNG